MKVTAVPTEHVAGIWPEIEPLLAKGIQRSGGRYTPDSVLRSLKAGEAQLWVAYRMNGVGPRYYGVGTTRIEDYPSRRMLNITFVGGVEMKEWKYELIAMWADFALRSNCSGMEATGREGWVRELRNDGWEQKYVVLERDLSNDVIYEKQEVIHG